MTHPQCSCGHIATFRCDYVGNDGACQQPICENCAISVSPDHDCCSRHAQLFIQGALPGIKPTGPMVSPGPKGIRDLAIHLGYV